MMRTSFEFLNIIYILTNSIESAVNESNAELNVGIFPDVWSLSLELIGFRQKSLLRPLWVLHQDLGVIE